MKQDRNEDILEKIKKSDMVLVGLGEDFDNEKVLRQKAEYRRGCELLKGAECSWLIPAWNSFCMEEAGYCTDIYALERLTGLLAGKNYFAVSLSVNPRIFHAFAGQNVDGTREAERLVMPCGSIVRKQCSAGCKSVLAQVTEEDRERLQKAFRKLKEGRFSDEDPLAGVCPECGRPYVLNNIYADNYNEEGYLEQWRRYTKWLQGTLNRSLMILELGVGMRFPTVVRWPFEKVAFFNEKAFFCRVNEKLYQLTKELSEKGRGIAKNAIDWLEQLC